MSTTLLSISLAILCYILGVKVGKHINKCKTLAWILFVSGEDAEKLIEHYEYFIED